MKDRLLQIASVAAFVSVLIFNYLAATGILNNTDTGAVSDRYPTQITPAGYAFSIWSLIYLGLLLFVVYQALPSNRLKEPLNSIRLPFIVNCAANCAWLTAWHYDLMALSVALMLTILVTLALISIRVSDSETPSLVLLVRTPFNLYFGWITVATIANTTIFLVSTGFEPKSAFGSYAGAALILAATAIGVLIRFRLNAFAYAMAIAWGITAIAVKQSGNTPVVVAAAVGVVVLLFVALWGAVKDK
ncbi:MAG: tryptophan-rich sensory protein [Acidobacteriota bacterium]|nr:MAG: tryptophan-rich sensory protein [Acidobacteriota bacterium]